MESEWIACWLLESDDLWASFFLMEKISGNKSIARSKMSYFMYFLGLFNLMFNWSHHIYTLPTEKYIRYVGYLVSMTEWVIFLRIIWTFRSTIESVRKHRNLISYRFLIAADVWVFLNLFMALLMSVPAINLYTHGTHITVAHAMGTTIGINSMILLGVMAFALNCNEFSLKQTRLISYSFWLLQFSLLFFGLVSFMLELLKLCFRSGFLKYHIDI
jgi:nitric oxide reductase subunit B